MIEVRRTINMEQFLKEMKKLDVKTKNKRKLPCDQMCLFFCLSKTDRW